MTRPGSSVSLVTNPSPWPMKVETMVLGASAIWLAASSLAQMKSQAMNSESEATGGTVGLIVTLAVVCVLLLAAIWLRRRRQAIIVEL